MLRRHVRRIATGHIDTPANPGKVLGDRATDNAGATKNQNSRHATTLAGDRTPSRAPAFGNVTRIEVSISSRMSDGRVALVSFLA